MVSAHRRRAAGTPGLTDLSLSSNATRLETLAKPLYRAGIRRLNVSLDSLRSDTFARITGGGRLEPVLRGIAAAQRAGWAETLTEGEHLMIAVDQELARPETSVRDGHEIGFFPPVTGD